RSKQPAQRGRLAREPPLGKLVFELREAINDRLLGIVAFDLSSGYLRRILRRDGSGHEVNERSVEGLRRIASLQHQPQAASRGRIIARWWLREAPSTRASASKLLQKMAGAWRLRRPRRKAEPMSRLPVLRAFRPPDLQEQGSPACCIAVPSHRATTAARSSACLACSFKRQNQ